MALPLGTSLPAGRIAPGRISRTASDLVRLHDLDSDPVIGRDRHAGRGILRIARDRDADLAVVGLDPHRVAARR